jgi:hypothetical protein
VLFTRILPRSAFHFGWHQSAEQYGSSAHRVTAASAGTATLAQVEGTCDRLGCHPPRQPQGAEVPTTTTGPSGKNQAA